MNKATAPKMSNKPNKKVVNGNGKGQTDVELETTSPYKDTPTSATGEALDILKYRTSEEAPEAVSLDEITVDGQPLVTRDADFDTELEYEGYKDIEEYDNDEFNANINDKPDSNRELNFTGRPLDDSISEEDITDKQDNRRSP